MASAFAPRDHNDRLIVALDVADPEAARDLVARLGDTVTFYKIGMRLVFAGGLALVDELAGRGRRVFLDMKLLDIDNTVADGIASIAGLGATLTTVHAYPKAMRAAVAGRNGRDRPGLLAVTVLTAMDDADLRRAGYRDDAAALVAARAADAAGAGMDGVVCAPGEAAAVRRILGPHRLIVTPGIRPAAGGDDQKRVATPAAAIAAGADYIVVGRPVIAAADPRAAAAAIVAEIASTVERKEDA